MPKTSNNKIAYYRQIMLAHARPMNKLAAIGGEQDTPFEQAFSNLAHAYLKDKAPGLLDYEVGFQLVDRNQDNTKAIGVFGFKVGSQWLYAPVFFLNGDLKGHELLYIKSQDLFVPMKENWLNYILNRKPHVLGETIPRSMSQAGVQPPNLYQLSRSPYKFASYSDWAKDAVVTFAHHVTQAPTKDVKYNDVPDLPTFLRKEGKAVVKKLLSTCNQFPKLASVIDQFHGMQVIGEIVKNIKAAAAGTHSVLDTSEGTNCKVTPQGLKCFKRNKSVVGDAANKKPELKIAVYKGDIDVPAGDEFHTLSDKEKSKLLQDGVLIKDQRGDASVAYDVKTKLEITNPSQTGIYEVLTKAGKWQKCLVIMGPHYHQGKKEFATIINLDSDKKTWLNIHPNHIWTKSVMDREGWEKWYEDQKDVSSLKVGATYVIVTPSGGTLPFVIDRELGDDTGIKSYDVYFYSYADKPRADHMQYPEGRKAEYDPPQVSDGSRVTLTGREGYSIRVNRGDVHVPAGCKAITIKEPPEDDAPFTKMKGKRTFFGCCGPLGASDPPAIQPGNLDDIQLLIMEKTSAMKIFHSGTEVQINDRTMSPLQGLIHLVRDHGLREKQARLMLKQAELKRSAKFRIKYADQYYDLQKNAPSAPSMPEPPQGFDPLTGGQYPTQAPFEANLPVSDMSATLTDRNIYRPQDAETGQAAPDARAMQAAQMAAQTGQKEVFDTVMISSLLKATRDDTRVDKWLPDIMKGMDRLGRILMIFYWHQEEFAERYGESELPELEDGLRNAFETVGDILLTLRQKTVDPYPDEISNVDLGQTAE